MIQHHTQRIGERKHYSLKSETDIQGVGSQAVRTFSGNINARRLERGLTVEQVYDLLLSYRWPHGTEPPALPSVGHWFNGTRRPRNMEHLKALCAVLDMSLDEASGAKSAEAATAVEHRMLTILRDLEPAAAEALLASGEAMRGVRRTKT